MSDKELCKHCGGLGELSGVDSENVYSLDPCQKCKGTGFERHYVFELRHKNPKDAIKKAIEAINNYSEQEGELG